MADIGLGRGIQEKNDEMGKNYRHGRQKTYQFKVNGDTFRDPPERRFEDLGYLSSVLRSFQYRLYPTKKHEARLFSQFHLCNELCNFMRSQCKETYEQSGKRLTRFRDDVRLPTEEAIVDESGTSRFEIEVGRPRL